MNSMGRLCFHHQITFICSHCFYEQLLLRIHEILSPTREIKHHCVQLQAFRPLDA